MVVFELHSLLVTKKCIGIEKVTFDGTKTMTSRTPITLFTLKFLNIKRTRNYYFKTIGYCSRTKVKSSLMLRRFYATWPDHQLTCQSEQAPIEGEQMIFSFLSQTGNLFTRGSTRLNELVTNMAQQYCRPKVWGLTRIFILRFPEAWPKLKLEHGYFLFAFYNKQRRIALQNLIHH